jgi:hypothetical protein
VGIFFLKYFGIFEIILIFAYENLLIMGTNYYRIPTAEEMESRKIRLENDIRKMTLSPNDIERGFQVPIDDQWNSESPWETFINGTNIHLGKRSGGWKFCWNFHKNKYYSNKEGLLNFIQSGRVVDEYGEELNVDEFIEMALNWGEPNGWVVNEEYRKSERMKGMGLFFDDPKYDDKIIDGLRVSSSTEFC